MATYRKPKISVNVYTVKGYVFDGDAVAYEALNAHKTVKAGDAERTILIPFHAVKTYGKWVTSESALKADSYCEESTHEDCTRTDLGTLIYCGDASDSMLLASSPSYCAEGVVGDWCEADAWRYLIQDENPCATAVIDGTVVVAEKTADNTIQFGDIGVTFEVDTETGDTSIILGNLAPDRVSHCAIYTKYNLDTGSCEE